MMELNQLQVHLDSLPLLFTAPHLFGGSAMVMVGSVGKMLMESVGIKIMFISKPIMLAKYCTFPATETF